jgi:hypothetical protein
VERWVVAHVVDTLVQVAHQYRIDNNFGMSGLPASLFVRLCTGQWEISAVLVTTMMGRRVAN